jgi:hypothetical protein
MPRLKPFFLALALLLAAALPLLAVCPAQADPLPALRAAPDERQSPGDPGWPLGQRVENGVEVTVSAEPSQPAGQPGAEPGRQSGGYSGGRAGGQSGDQPGDQPATGFRIVLRPRPGAKAAGLRACAGLASTIRRNLHKTRAIVLEIRAERPVAGLATITSANTERPGARDRHFGSFVIGTGWKTLRLTYGDLTPLPGWPQEAARLGFEPGDLVLRPDSVEAICIGAEAGRLPPEGVVLHIRDLRFAP